MPISRRGPGVLRRTLIKNIGCPCCHPFRGTFGITEITVCGVVDDDGT